MCPTLEEVPLINPLLKTPHRPGKGISGEFRCINGLIDRHIMECVTLINMRYVQLTIMIVTHMSRESVMCAILCRESAMVNERVFPSPKVALSLSYSYEMAVYMLLVYLWPSFCV